MSACCAGNAGCSLCGCSRRSWRGPPSGRSRQMPTFDSRTRTSQFSLLRSFPRAVGRQLSRLGESMRSCIDSPRYRRLAVANLRHPRPLCRRPSPLPRQRQPIPNGQQRHVDAWVVAQLADEMLQRRCVGDLRGPRHAAAPQRVVDRHQTARAQQLQTTFVAGVVAGLVGIDEGEVLVPGGAGRELRVERLERRGEAPNRAGRRACTRR